MNYNLLNIPYIEEKDYRTYFTVGGIGSLLKHFRRSLAREKSTQSDYIGVTKLAINQRHVYSSVELQYYYCGCGRTKWNLVSGYV
ncbi:hypothetical protein TNCV_2433171 [Trichonephila clavipes]|nr:hypothetical protein TNCV_2433171 [Trichonephila clavipes]